jgi:hypothetical protein
VLSCAFCSSLSQTSALIALFPWATQALASVSLDDPWVEPRRPFRMGPLDLLLRRTRKPLHRDRARLLQHLTVAHDEIRLRIRDRMMGAWWLLSVGFVFLFLVSAINYGWGFRRWGPPHLSYVQRRRALSAPATSDSIVFDHKPGAGSATSFGWSSLSACSRPPSLRFTFYCRQAQRWGGVDFSVGVATS